jgi:hypothetical protein
MEPDLLIALLNKQWCSTWVHLQVQFCSKNRSFILFSRFFGLWAGLGSHALGWRLNHVMISFHGCWGGFVWFVVGGRGVSPPSHSLWGNTSTVTEQTTGTISSFIQFVSMLESNRRPTGSQSYFTTTEKRVLAETSGTQWCVVEMEMNKEVEAAGTSASNSPSDLFPTYELLHCRWWHQLSWMSCFAVLFRPSR